MNGGGNSGGIQSEINVTPLIDVLLVLLIIFIVIMPIMVKSEALEVPRTAEPGSVTETAPLTVTLKNDLQVVFNDGEKDAPIQATDLARTLRPKLGAMSSKVVLWKGPLGGLSSGGNSVISTVITENDPTKASFNFVVQTSSGNHEDVSCSLQR